MSNGLSMNRDLKSGAEARALQRLRPFARWSRGREAFGVRAVYRRFRFMSTEQFKQEQVALHEPPVALNPNLDLNLNHWSEITIKIRSKSKTPGFMLPGHGREAKGTFLETAQVHCAH